MKIKHQLIGHTKKAHGIKGELKVFIKDKYLEDFAQAHVLFLEIAGKPLPYFIQGIDVKSDLLVHFEDVSSREAASQLAGKPVLLRVQDLIPEEERTLEVVSNLEYYFLEGYTMQEENEEIGVIGEIIGIEEFPQQEMAFVAYKDREIMVPLNEFIIASINKEKKIVLVNLPEGLLEM